MKVEERKLFEIDHSKLEGFDNLDPELVDQEFDEDNAYSVPYLWGTTGLAYDAADLDGENVTAWADLWNDKYQGKVMLTNDMREVFHIGLRVLGYSGNSTSPEEIEQAYEKLAELMPAVRTFNSDAPHMPYLEGETDIGMNAAVVADFASRSRGCRRRRATAVADFEGRGVVADF